MRVTKYARSDGQNWIVARIRHSPHLASAQLDTMMRMNGWVRWNLLRERFNELKQRIAQGAPTKFPNWKEVKIPMFSAKLDDLPAGIHKQVTLVGEDGKPIESIKPATDSSNSTTSASSDI